MDSLGTVDIEALNRMAIELSKHKDLSAEGILVELRKREVPPARAVYVLSRVFGMSLGDAKAALHSIKSWADLVENWERFHSQMDSE